MRHGQCIASQRFQPSLNITQLHSRGGDFSRSSLPTNKAKAPHLNDGFEDLHVAGIVNSFLERHIDGVVAAVVMSNLKHVTCMAKQAQV